MTTASEAAARRRRTSPPTLGQAPDALTPLVLTLVGAGLVIGAWIAVSGEPEFARQVGYLNLAVAGLLVAAVGQAYFLVTRRRAVRLRVAALSAPQDDEGADDA